MPDELHFQGKIYKPEMKYPSVKISVSVPIDLLVKASEKANSDSNSKIIQEALKEYTEGR